ncbi:MAG: SDR family NAD(P)-dependent oxidoreductase, partial [Ilumatobacter sp.]
MGTLDGRVVVVTGAGRGLGRSHALLLAAEGAQVVVNDLGTTTDGAGAEGDPADEVVAEIVAAGGSAVANRDDVADWDGARALVACAIEQFGDLDAVVN